MSESKTSSPSGSKFDDVYEECLNDIDEYSPHAEDNDNSGRTGLMNQGNSCYVNCVLQSLLNTPKFAFLYVLKALKPFINVKNTRGTKGALTGCLSAVADCFWSSEYKCLDTRVFMKVFSKEVNAEFDGKAEEDAHEFQMLLLDRLAEDVNRVTWPVNFAQEYSDNASTITAETFTRHANDYYAKQLKYSSSIVSDLFRLVICATNNCPICMLTRTNFEELTNLSIGIAEGGLTVCLNKHFEPSAMERTCPKCGKQDFLRSMSIWQLPEILIIHLKRFNFEGGETVKNDKDVDFPIYDLDMRRFLHPNSPSRSNGTVTLYSLHAIVAHSGSATTGHYTARVKNLDSSTDVWQCFDDKDKRELKKNEIKSNAAYMLYYHRNGMTKHITSQQMNDEKRQHG